MEHVTACYWQKEEPAGLFLALQHRIYRRQRASVVCACISDKGEQVRSLQNRMEEELEDRIIWQPHREEILLEKWTDLMKEQKEDSNYAGILCVENRGLLFHHGRMQICGAFHRFGRNQWKTMREACMVGEIEPGTALLVADNAFLNFGEEELETCLQPQIIAAATVQDRADNAGRRLKELGEKAERQGGKHMGAVWILPVEGEDIWSRE